MSLSESATRMGLSTMKDALVEFLKSLNEYDFEDLRGACINDEIPVFERIAEKHVAEVHRQAIAKGLL